MQCEHLKHRFCDHVTIVSANRILIRHNVSLFIVLGSMILVIELNPSELKRWHFNNTMFIFRSTSHQATLAGIRFSIKWEPNNGTWGSFQKHLYLVTITLLNLFVVQMQMHKSASSRCTAYSYTSTLSLGKNLIIL